MGSSINNGCYYVGHRGHSAKDQGNGGLSSGSPKGDSGGDGKRFI